MTSQSKMPASNHGASEINASLLTTKSAAAAAAFIMRDVLSRISLQYMQTAILFYQFCLSLCPMPVLCQNE